MRTLSGKQVVITGGSSGLGLELAHRLAAEGAELTLVARSRARLDDAARAVRQRTPGVTVAVAAVDVADEPGLDRAFAEIVGRTGSVDVLINSAGILREGYFEELPASDFRDVMDVNFFGTVNAIRAALPYLKRSRGRIVNIASVAGLMGVFGYTPYTASKHALVGFTESLRFELQPQGVGVQLICPGEFDSPMVAALDASRTPENREHTLTIPKLAVEQIAAEVLRGIRRDTPFVVPGRQTRLVVSAQRLLPGVARAVSTRRIKKVYVGPGSTA